MNTTQEAALALGVVALGGVLLYYNSASNAEQKSDADKKKWDCSERDGGSPLEKAINKLGYWTGAQQCNPGEPDQPKKRTVRVFSGYGSKGPQTCDPNDETCDDDRDRDCDVVHTVQIDLTEDDIAAKRAAHLLIESDADIDYLKNRCKQEEATRQHQIQSNRDEETRYNNLFTRLNNQFQADVNAGKNPNKLYTPELLRAQCVAAQLGSAYTQKVLDSFASQLAAFDRRIISPLPTKSPFAGRDYDKFNKQLIKNWEDGIDKAKPNGPWPSPPTAQALIDGSGYPPALAKTTADTLHQYLLAAQAQSTKK